MEGKVQGSIKRIRGVGAVSRTREAVWPQRRTTPTLPSFRPMDALQRSWLRAMKPFVLLVVSVLAPALPQSGASDFPVGVERSGYPYGNDYPGVARFSDGYSEFGYGAPPRSPTGDSVHTRRDGRFWVPAPSLPSAGRRPDSYDADSYPFDRSQSGAPSLYEQFRPRSSHYGSDWMGQESARGFGTRQEGAIRQDRYRFRGDDDSGKDSGNGEVWRGYRFRHQTAQERERADARPGWRPIEEERDRRQPAPTKRPEFGVDESYGYQADDWFGRHFGRGSR